MCIMYHVSHILYIVIISIRSIDSFPNRVVLLFSYNLRINHYIGVL